MTLTVSPQTEARLFEVARQEGIDPGALIDKWVREYGSAAGANSPQSSDPQEHVRALLTQWQAADQTPLIDTVKPREGETPTEALFRQWEEEDAAMTPDDQEADTKLWMEYQQGINEERIRNGMQPVF